MNNKDDMIIDKILDMYIITTKYDPSLINDFWFKKLGLSDSIDISITVFDIINSFMDKIENGKHKGSSKISIITRSDGFRYPVKTEELE